jgi:CHASE3 domain sensor protein
MSYRRKRNNTKIFSNSTVDFLGALMVTFIFGLYFYNSLTKTKDNFSRNQVEKIMAEVRNRSLKIAQQLLNDPKLREFTLRKTIKDWNNDKYLYFI